jgi:hypothetical protein
LNLASLITGGNTTANQETLHLQICFAGDGFQDSTYLVANGFKKRASDVAPIVT